jgi:hypothetical protein
MRKPLDKDFKASHLEDVVDPEIRRILQDWLERHDNDFKRAFGDPKNHPSIVIKHGPQAGQTIPIHKVRMKFHREVTPIGEGERLRHVWTRGNSHIEIFAFKDANGNVAKWEGRVVTRLDAYRRVKHKRPVVNRTWTENHEFLFSLTQGDVVELDVEPEADRTVREPYLVRGISFQGGGIFELTHIRDARKKGDIPPKVTEEETTFVRRRPYVDGLRKLNCQKVSINPIGEICPAND